MSPPFAPLVSVIIPTHNPGPKLARSVESALEQAGAPEVIVMDAASGDGTPTLLASYGESVRWVSEPDRGTYDAMNRGIALSTGRYLYFLGAGDTLRPGVLAALAPSLEAQAGAAMVYGDVTVKGDFYGGEWSSAQFRRGFNISHQAIFYSREVFDLLGAYDLRYAILADQAFNMRAWGDKRIAKRHVDLLIADYEGGGLSENTTDDAFWKMFPALVRRGLGWKQYGLYYATRLAPKKLRALLRRG